MIDSLGNGEHPAQSLRNVSCPAAAGREGGNLAVSQSAAPRPGALLNLQGVEESQRAALWSRSARTFFPGLSVRSSPVNPQMGSITGITFGAGRLWTVLSPPLLVSYDPDDAPENLTQIFSVMLQLEGTTIACQHRTCVLHPGEFCVIDSKSPFDLEVSAVSSRIMFMQMPRHAVLSRYPYLERRTAETFDPEEGGAILLRSLLMSLLETAPLLEDEQRATALAVTIQMLGAPKLHSGDSTHEIGWRVRTALACIDTQLSDTSLTANRVSKLQDISRRRLDDLMTRAMGTSVTAQIWIRRLTQAATELADPRYRERTVSEIAFEAGFEDAAHFTRAFKRRYQCTPREWRNRGGYLSTHGEGT
jgi:AraC family transcriptional regulator, positive regulator of tynA and feaB